MKVYYQIRSKFGVRTLSNTEILSDLIATLKEIGCKFSLYSSTEKNGNWQKVEGIYNVK